MWHAARSHSVSQTGFLQTPPPCACPAHPALCLTGLACATPLHPSHRCRRRSLLLLLPPPWRKVPPALYCRCRARYASSGRRHLLTRKREGWSDGCAESVVEFAGSGRKRGPGLASTVAASPEGRPRAAARSPGRAGSSESQHRQLGSGGTDPGLHAGRCGKWDSKLRTFLENLV